MNSEVVQANSAQDCQENSVNEQGIFHETRIRLEEIAETVQGEGVELDEMLTLFEEAVNLGACAVAQVEDDINPDVSHSDEAVSQTPEQAQVPTQVPTQVQDQVQNQAHSQVQDDENTKSISTS